ncbi:MAG: peptide chain release factor N(5)-glutamine methyltransferase [Gammaproteobacteria bacterium]|nr:peptide chain release factor N(5)-glutamine methyltransferase [Gammaproteobacteria bacterium]
MASVRDLLEGARRLPGDSARRDAEILLCHCLARPRSWLYTWPEAEVEAPQARRYASLLEQREQGVPVAYLTGQRDFWSMQLTVNEHTLIPRPETETLVEWALELPLPAAAEVVDLGTGSGAIALALASERSAWQVSALERSADALAVAQANAANLGLGRVHFQQSDWYGALGGRRFHLLLSNPPYVEEQDAHLQRGDLRFEPRDALVAGQGGLADLEVLVSGAPRHLLDGGWLLLEHGYTQGAAVRRFFQRAGFHDVATRRDIAGQERISGGCWHAQ